MAPELASVEAAAISATQPERLRLIFFYSPTSGRCRRVESFLALVLQSRRDRHAFELVRVSVDERSDLAERFGIDTVPTLILVEGRKIKRRIPNPRQANEIRRQLAPWLQRG